MLGFSLSSIVLLKIKWKTWCELRRLPVRLEQACELDSICQTQPHRDRLGNVLLPREARQPMEIQTTRLALRSTRFPEIAKRSRTSSIAIVKGTVVCQDHTSICEMTNSRGATRLPCSSTSRANDHRKDLRTRMPAEE